MKRVVVAVFFVLFLGTLALGVASLVVDER